MNMGSIYKQFEKEQEKLRKEYLAAGMTEVQILWLRKKLFRSTVK